MKIKSFPTRRRMVLLSAAFVAVGASTPSACTPKPLPVQTVVGRVTQGASTPAHAGAVCRLIDPHDGRPKYRGEPGGWGERIAARDPKEWLSMSLCWDRGSGALGGTLIDTGSFTLYTSQGTLKGLVTWGALANDPPQRFEFRLKITSGSGSYAGTTGPLVTLGCTNSSVQVIAGSLGTTTPPTPAVCNAA